MLKTALYGCRYWVPVGIYAALIFYASSLSHPEAYVPSLLFDLGDKTLHAIEYAVLGVLCYRAFRRAAGTWASSHAVILAIIAASVYGLTDEFHQAFVPLRESDVWDSAADAIGATLGSSLWHWVGTIIDASQSRSFSKAEKKV